MTVRDVDQPLYDHTQPGTVVRVICIVIMLWLGTFAFLAAPFLYLIVGVILVLALLFHALNVRIDEKMIELRMGIGLISKSIPLESVVSCKPVRNSLMYGFGIRYVFDGWMWNVSGLDAVQLTFSDGKHFRIGTDEPEALESAINLAIGCSTHDDTAAD